MTPVDTQLESQISLHLDGQLTAQAQADLYRQLLRNPKARQMLDDYTANDRLVTDALRAALGSRPTAPAADLFTTDPRRAIPWRTILASAAILTLAAGAWIAWEYFNATHLPTRSIASDNRSASSVGPQIASAISQPKSQSIDSIIADLSDSKVTPWWRQQPQPQRDGRLVDDTVAAPVLPAVHHGQIRTQQSILGVIDEDMDTIYWLQMQGLDSSLGLSATEL